MTSKSSLEKQFETISISSYDSQQSHDCYNILNESVLNIKKINSDYLILDQLGHQVGTIKPVNNKILIQSVDNVNDSIEIFFQYKKLGSNSASTSTGTSTSSFPIVIPLGFTPLYETSIEPFIIINFNNFIPNLTKIQKLSVLKTVCTTYIDYYTN